MKLETGAKVWLIDGLKGSNYYSPPQVFDGEVQCVLGERGFIARGRGVYTIGENACFESSEAYSRGLAATANALAALGDETEEYLAAWNTIMEAYIPDVTMKPGWSVKNFAAWEFLCPDCKREFMNRRFIMRLMLSRGIAGIPYVIGSGWRCPVRNAAVGGVEDSSHLPGLAADVIATTSRERFIIINASLRAGFRRIGVSRYYVHLDTHPTKAQDIIYLYKEAA